MSTIETSSEKSSFSRRNLLRTAAGSAVAIAIAAGCGGSSHSQAAGVTDADILNFALNLEYLEAEFYTYATTGNGITNAGVGVTGTGSTGATTGGSQVQFVDPNLKAVALELAADEQAHVNFLRAALGSQAVAKPAINLNALGIGFASDQQFLTLARAFEDTGVSAYGGAVTYISSKTYLQAAAQILGTEALHAGNLRLFIDQKSISITALDSLDVVPPPAGTQFFTTTPPAQSALAVIRTTTQVLNIVYAGGAHSGGFFPNGLNGNIH